jgi:hypothetical protein
MRALRRRCEARLAALPLAAPFDLEAFYTELAARRGRRIILEAAPLSGSTYGVCFCSHDTDYIFYERDTSPYHRQHIILHELSHLICGHLSSQAEPLTNVGGLFDSVDLSRLRAVMQRASYSAVEEREAEIMATLLAQRVSVLGGLGTTPLADRLAASLDDAPLQTGVVQEARP